MKNKNNKKEERNSLAIRGQEMAPRGRADSMTSFSGMTPFKFMRRFADDMQKMFEDFNNFGLMPRFDSDFGLRGQGEEEQSVWAPQIEVRKNNGQLAVRADLPGMKKEDIDVKVTDDSLVISGERKQESKEEREGYYRSECTYGSFYRNIPLPAGADKENATASFNNGVLEVTVAVPKDESQERKIEIIEKSEASLAKTA